MRFARASPRPHPRVHLVACEVILLLSSKGIRKDPSQSMIFQYIIYTVDTVVHFFLPGFYKLREVVRG